jgi:hypothetical protein
LGARPQRLELGQGGNVVCHCVKIQMLVPVYLAVVLYGTAYKKPLLDILSPGGPGGCVNVVVPLFMAQYSL